MHHIKAAEKVIKMATRLAKNIEFPVNSKEVDRLECEETATRTLSTRDSHALLEILNSDIEPSDADVEAFARYKRSTIERPVRD